jgi:hypothetical protein
MGPFRFTVHQDLGNPFLDTIPVTISFEYFWRVSVSNVNFTDSDIVFTGHNHIDPFIPQTTPPDQIIHAQIGIEYYVPWPGGWDWAVPKVIGNISPIDNSQAAQLNIESTQTFIISAAILSVPEPSTFLLSFLGFILFTIVQSKVYH